MARRGYTKQLYELLVQSYRDQPGNSSAAARHAGCNRRTAQRAYEHGWPSHTWAPPIKDFLKAEKERIRAERARELQAARDQETEMREQLQKDAINAQKQEAAGSQQARANSLALANVIGQIAVACIPLSKRVAEAVRHDTKMSPHSALKLFSSMAYVVRQGNESLRLALEIERLRVGEPTSILKLQAEDMTVDDVADSLSHLHRTLQRAVDRGDNTFADDLAEVEGAEFEGEDDDPDAYSDDEAADPVH